MPPRPTPDDSLLAEAKPYLARGRRRSGLALHGLDEQEVWDDEHGSSIELTGHHVCISSNIGGDDPLLVSLTRPEDAACLHDGEIAALMAAEWNKQERKSKIYAKTRADRPMTVSQKCLGCAVAMVVLLGLMGLGVFAIVYGLGEGSHHTSSYQCPSSQHPLNLPSLEQLIKEQVTGNNTSVCRSDFDYACTCQNPTSIPLHEQTKVLDDELKKETALLQGQEGLDVVFVGQFMDILEDEELWNAHSINKVQIAQEDDLRSTSLLYRFTKQGIVPTEAQPRVWWIRLGQQDLLRDGCSLDALHAGMAHIVQRILDRSGMDTVIVLSPPPTQPLLDDSNNFPVLLSEWSDRMKCVAATNDRLIFFDPHHPETSLDAEKEDDDFFLDVSSGSSSQSKTTTTDSLSPEEAVIDKLDELLLP